MSRSDVTLWARDITPALVVVVVASLVVSSQVSAADGMLPVLVAVGLLAIAVAAVVLYRADALLSAAQPAASLSSSSLPPDQPAVDDDRSAPSGPPVPLRPTPEPPAPAPKQRQPVPPSKPTKWLPSAVRALRFEPVAMTVPKLGNTAEENEDAYAFDAAAGRVVVADGASSSFASREWSRALCSEMVSDPTLLDSGAAMAAATTRAAVRWKAAVSSPSENVAWWAQQGLERGAFAALLVVEIARVGKKEGWRAAAVGDSCLIQLRPSAKGWKIVASFPSAPGEEFSSHPDLVQSATPGEIEGLRWAAGVLASGDVLVTATDAVSELALTHPDPAVLALLAEAEPDELARDFTRRRQGDGMVNDDCTLVRVHTTAPLR